MTTGLGLSAYIDVPTYLRAPINQETASLLGMNTTSTEQADTGSRYHRLRRRLLDLVDSRASLDTRRAPASEVVTITGSADGTHVTLASPGTAFAHSAGASISQGGSKGSLAESDPASLRLDRELLPAGHSRWGSVTVCSCSDRTLGYAHAHAHG